MTTLNLSADHNALYADIRRRWKSETALSSIEQARVAGLPQWNFFQSMAIEAFGKLNGWSLICKHKEKFRPFDWQVMSQQQKRFFDHTFSYNRAFVTQPYGHCSWIDEAAEYAAKRRYPLQVHVPPIPLASFHLPGSTAIVVFTKPGRTVKWLPEQLTGIAA